MGIEENKKLVREWYAEWNKGNIEGVLALHTSNVVDHNPVPGQGAGIEGLKQGLMVFRTAFPDMQITVDRLVADGDLIADNVTATGTHQGELMGMPATGKRVTITASNIWRISNGKITDIWHVEDVAGMMQQLGAMSGA